MTSSAALPHRILPAVALALAVGAPSLAQAAPDGAAATVAAAKKSKLFKRTLKRRGIAKAGLAKVSPAPGVEMDFLRYVKATALTARPELKPLMKKSLRGAYLDGRPAYNETIVELTDRLVVDRTLVVKIKPGMCEGKTLPKEVKDLCFVSNPKGKKTKALIKELAAIRKNLGKRSGSELVIGTVTAEQAKKMSDKDLVALLLNSDTRTIRHVSVVPRKASKPGTLTKGSRAFDKLAATGKMTTNLVSGSSSPTPGSKPMWTGPKQTFDTDYFLTGWTLGDEIDDTWEYTLANASWWHGRYYVRVDYHLGFGFGVRAPFSVDIEHSQGGSNERKVSMKVAPVDVDKNGAPAYPAVGLPQSKYFDGKEFVLELEASCKLKVAIPGPDINQDCPGVKLDRSRHINPVIGDESSALKDWWLEGDDIGLGIDISVAKASLDIGIGADVTKGKIGVKVSPLQSSTISGLPSGHVWRNTRDPLEFSVKRTTNTKSAGFRLQDPRYGFDVRVRPKLRAQVGIDVWVYEKDWTLGPWALDFLSISKSFQLDHHDGTVSHHDYKLFDTTHDQVKLPGTGNSGDNTGKKPPKPPVKPTKPVGKKPGGTKLPGPKGKLPGGAHPK